MFKGRHTTTSMHPPSGPLHVNCLLSVLIFNPSEAMKAMFSQLIMFVT